MARASVLRKKVFVFSFSLPLAALLLLAGPSISLAQAQNVAGDTATLRLLSRSLAPNPRDSGARSIKIGQLFYETAQGRVALPAKLTTDQKSGNFKGQASMPDGRIVNLSLQQTGQSFLLSLNANLNSDILKWGLAIDALDNEYYTGLMERVIDGPQQASWAPGLQAAMNLRGQKVDMILKPTTSIYAPFYLSSRGYAVFVKGDWPGRFDMCASNPSSVGIEFEGPSLTLKVYTADSPAALVRAHALDAGPPFLPPRWMFQPWRWRDEHSQLSEYYDGVKVTGPFNSQVMEDVLLMKAYGIPNGVYWIDRPWGPGRLGYDDFEIDPKRLPHFPEMVKWLNEQQTQMMLWIAPFYQGQMEREALAKGYNLAGQDPFPNNYPMVDMTNPAARKFWQDGVAKLLRLGVAGFKLDRGEENIPERGPFKVFDGRSIRENRNAYPPMYVKAAFDIAKQLRGNDFLMMPRAAYTGSSPYSVFWGGDVTGTQEGLRASIIAVQRAAVMGYPNWGSDTCGYGARSPMEQEVCGRWLAFSAFTPIMEVGPTRNVGFWNLPREPSYDATLIAIWRLYARLHQRLANYGYEQARAATSTGLPIIRPVFLVDPKSPESWKNWWTYSYGPDLLVSPVWEKGQRTQQVYLPSGSRWQDAWNTRKIYQGGQTITVSAELHQIPLFIRVGAKIKPGDLNAEWQESEKIAKTRPDLKSLDAQVRTWFEQNSSRSRSQ